MHLGHVIFILPMPAGTTTPNDHTRTAQPSSWPENLIKFVQGTGEIFRISMVYNCRIARVGRDNHLLGWRVFRALTSLVVGEYLYAEEGNAYSTLWRVRDTFSGRMSMADTRMHMPRSRLEPLFAKYNAISSFRHPASRTFTSSSLPLLLPPRPCKPGGRGWASCERSPC